MSKVYETDRDSLLEEKRPFPLVSGHPIGPVGGPVGPLGVGSLGPTSSGGVQTHVHHHFHHGDKEGVQVILFCLSSKCTVECSNKI